MKKNILFPALIVFLCVFPKIAQAFVEDSASASIKLTLRYVLDIKKAKKTSRSISEGETGNIPVSMNLSFKIEPFLWKKNFMSNFYIVNDSRFHQDRTSSEFGLGYKKDKIDFFVSYGFRVIRKEGESVTKGLSLGFEKKPTRSIGTSFDFNLLGVKADLLGKISFDSDKKWFYLGEVRVFLLGENSPFSLSIFHESYFGNGAYVIYRSRDESTDLFSGYLFPENRSEKVYRRNEGFVFGLTHRWK